MKVRMTVESADLRVGQANIRLIPTMGAENNGNGLFLGQVNGQVSGNQAFTLSLTNRESFGSFLPGSEIDVTFDVVSEGESIQPTSDKPQPTVTPTQPGAGR